MLLIRGRAPDGAAGRPSRLRPAGRAGPSLPAGAPRTLALLGAILAQTERIRVFQDVGNLPLRPPAAFAKAAATPDLLSGGRFEAGLGGGGFLEAAHGMGAPALTAGESIDALEEAILILRAWWSGIGELRFAGHHFQLDGARPGPKPADPTGIWLGAIKPRALTLTGRKADGWAAPLMNYLPPADAADAQEAIDVAARAAGRDPSLIRSDLQRARRVHLQGAGPGARYRQGRSSARRSIGRRS
jgi:alkanesulfonate monooxygenase SsuD/methylene tetrahydromethanopterin reductase-like flavin-dependent oxidoreductase (luciferase family)